MPSPQSNARSPTLRNFEVKTKIETPTLRWPHGTPMKHLPPSQPLLAQDPALLKDLYLGSVSWIMVLGSQPCYFLHRQVSSAERPSRTQCRSNPNLLRPSRMPQPLLSGLRLVPRPATLQHRSKIFVRFKTQVESLILAS